jgi:hypothetical protein
VAVVDLMLLLLLHLFDDVCVDCISASAIAARTMLLGHRKALRDEKFSKCAAAPHDEDGDAVRASALMFALTRKVHPSCSPEQAHTELLFECTTSPLPSKIDAAGGDIRPTAVLQTAPGEETLDNVQTRKHLKRNCLTT